MDFDYFYSFVDAECDQYTPYLFEITTRSRHGSENRPITSEEQAQCEHEWPPCGFNRQQVVLQSRASVLRDQAAIEHLVGNGSGDLVDECLAHLGIAFQQLDHILLLR